MFIYSFIYALIYLFISDSFNHSPTTEEHQPHLTRIFLTLQGLNDLVAYMDDEGHCIVNSFTVDWKDYEKVYFDEPMDVANLNLDEIVYFRHKKVFLDDNKPPVDQGLNRKAQIIFDQVWPHDKDLHAPIKDPEHLQAMNFEGKLRRVCDKNDTRFLEYRPVTGSWVFKVNHFSKYGLTESNEEENDSAPTGPKKLKPNGGQLLEKNEKLLQPPGTLPKKLDQLLRTLGGFFHEEDLSLINYLNGKPVEFSKSSAVAMNMDVNTHKLQLMKVSFFAEDDYDSRSEISDISESRASAY